MGELHRSAYSRYGFRYPLFGVLVPHYPSFYLRLIIVCVVVGWQHLKTCHQTTKAKLSALIFAIFKSCRKTWVRDCGNTRRWFLFGSFLCHQRKRTVLYKSSAEICTRSILATASSIMASISSFCSSKITSFTLGWSLGCFGVNTVQQSS